MPAAKKKTKSTKWRDTPDSILLIKSTRSALHRAESLRPSLRTIERAACGEPAAREILSAWAFQEPVVVVKIAASAVTA